MKPRAILLFFLLLFFSCQKEVKTSDTFLDQLPDNASFLVKVNDMTAFLSELKNSMISKKGKILNFVDLLYKKSETLSFVNTDQKTLLGFYKVGRENYDFVLVTKSNPDFFNVSRIENHSSETFTYQNRTLNKITFNQNEIYTSEKNGFQLLSSSQMLLENVLRTDSYAVNQNLERLYQASEENKSATVFMNLRDASFLSEKTARKNPLAEWISLDISLGQNSSSLTGVAITSDSTKAFIDLFKNTSPLNSRTPVYAPSKTEALISYTFNDFDTFQKNQSQFLDRVKVVDTLLNTIEEIGVALINKKKVVFLNSYGGEGLSDFFSENKTSSSTYQGSDINGFKDKDFISSVFDPLIDNFNSNYYTVLENTFVFSETVEPLQTVISNYRNKSTFSTSTTYTSAVENFANESSLFFVSNHTGLDFVSEQPFLAEIFNTSETQKLKNHTFGAQFVADNGFMHTSFLVSETKKIATKNSTIPLFTIELDTDLATEPFFVKNHRNNKQEIVVQDKDNFLYLISTNGKVLWKKQLEGRIQGRIHQVDIYKNGRLQLAFCTNNEFMVVDRNGEDVPPFRIKYDGGNLNPLAVFDYEGNRDYRFVVTQGEKIFMYNNRAQIVDGFTFKEAASEIIRTPRHFRVSGKDFLVFQLADKTLKILHRTGRDRISVKQKVDFSKNGVFLYKNKFSTTDRKGVLVQVDTKGKITKTNFNLNKDHGMYATSKTLALMNDNILSIKGKKVELELGVYLEPKIFYIYDKIYISVTDVQNQKIYLFDSQAKPIANFPVFGNSVIDMVDMEGDRKLEIVAKDQDNSLIVYKIN
ncbi:MAG: ribonuclease HII [Bacteroidota bacterium]